MANPVPLTYSALLHSIVAGGRAVTPAWKPTDGVMRGAIEQNTFMSVKPSAPWTHQTNPAGSPAAITDGFWQTITNDYSGGIFNPYWNPSGGRSGCLLMHGGGHSATNFNGIVAFDLDTQQYSIVYLGTPGDQMYPVNTTHCTYADGQPGAMHTYDTLVLAGPEAGYPLGALIRPTQMAVFSDLSQNSNSVFLFDFARQDLGWQALFLPASVLYFGAGGAACYDPVRMRAWWAYAGNEDGRQFYFNLETQAHVQVSLPTGKRRFTAHTDRQIMRYDENRQILIFADMNTERTTRRFYWMDCTNPAAGWTQATTSAEWGDPGTGFHSFHLAHDTRRDVWCGYTHSNNNVIWYLRLPTNLTDPWVFVAKPFIQGEGYSLPNSLTTYGGRWAYVHRFDVFILKATAANDIMAYKPEYY